MSERSEKIEEVALQMAQELQELVDEAIEAAGDPGAMMATQNLLCEWDLVYRL